MKITQVEYSRLANLGNYENERVSAVAAVADDEDPDFTLDELKIWVDLQLGGDRDVAKRRADLQTSVRRLEGEELDLASKIEQARKQWEAVEAFMGAVGLHLPNSVQDDIPF